jgi:hypothetical protein
VLYIFHWHSANLPLRKGVKKKKMCVCIYAHRERKTRAHTHRYPVALNCKHVYNWSTLTAKKSNGQFVLFACARMCVCVGVRSRARARAYARARFL